ncbi:MAG: mannose-6-phosphate isomerase-like protein (cupin superfamily) [Candidatus Latescibacterota bacterium]|jgi:mannose-6-phosphate isomerase-like protein (cupin superfamily)
MPVFRSAKGAAPPWCEMHYFDIVRLAPGENYQYHRDGEREKLIVGGGRARMQVAGVEMEIEQGANLDIGRADASFVVLEVAEPVVLVRMCGQWGDECGGSGLFRVENTTASADKGDVVDYEKCTNLDSHYHDCDEFWILYEGRATAVSEGKVYFVQAGDCLATGMGFHHDMPVVEEPVRAVYFETALEGKKRRGHLWDHTHGVAVPIAARV